MHGELRFLLAKTRGCSNLQSSCVSYFGLGVTMYMSLSVNLALQAGRDPVLTPSVDLVQGVIFNRTNFKLK